MSVRRISVPTSTTHEHKHVCRWEARAGAPAGQSDASVGTKAHAQRGRRQLPAIQEWCWQVSWAYPAKHRTIERPPARWCRREHAAQPALRRRAVGSSTGKVNRRYPKESMHMHHGSNPTPSVGGAAPRLLRGSSRAGLYANSASIAQASRTRTRQRRHVRMGAHRIRRDGLTRPPSSHPIIRRRADPLEPGGSIVGRTTRRGFKATVLSCANGAMTDRLSQCKKLEHGLPGLNLGIRLKPYHTSHCGIASASLACPTGALAACPAHVVYGYWPRVILVSVSSTPRRHEHARAKLTRDRCARLDRSAIVGKGRGPANPAVPLQGIPRRKRRNAVVLSMKNWY